jgi:hypothetical protein
LELQGRVLLEGGTYLFRNVRTLPFLKTKIWYLNMIALEPDNIFQDDSKNGFKISIDNREWYLPSWQLWYIDGYFLRKSQNVTENMSLNHKVHEAL